MSNSIPKIVHLIWKTRTIPDKFSKMVHSWKLFNPDVRVKVWGDADVEKFITKIFPNYLDLYHFLKYDIQKADLARLLILYKIGGIYADLDYECLKPIDFWNEHRMVISNEPVEHNNQWISNAFFACPKKHPYVIKIARHGREKIKLDDLNIHGSFGAAAYAEVIRYEESLLSDALLSKVHYLDSSLVFPIPDISRSPALHVAYKDKVINRDFGDAIGVHYWDHSFLITWAILDVYPQYHLLDMSVQDVAVAAVQEDCGCGNAKGDDAPIKSVSFNPVIEILGPKP